MNQTSTHTFQLSLPPGNTEAFQSEEFIIFDDFIHPKLYQNLPMVTAGSSVAIAMYRSSLTYRLLDTQTFRFITVEVS